MPLNRTARLPLQQKAEENPAVFLGYALCPGRLFLLEPTPDEAANDAADNRRHPEKPQ
jgi:hypothetical protein